MKLRFGVFDVKSQQKMLLLILFDICVMSVVIFLTFISLNFVYTFVFFLSKQTEGFGLNNYMWCLFGRITVEIDIPRKLLSTDAKPR